MTSVQRRKQQHMHAEDAAVNFAAGAATIDMLERERDEWKQRALAAERKLKNIRSILENPK